MSPQNIIYSFALNVFNPVLFTKTKQAMNGLPQTRSLEFLFLVVIGRRKPERAAGVTINVNILDK
jgi:hypothetical protein